MAGYIIVVIVVAVITFLLCVPVYLTFRLEMDKGPKLRARVTWLFGLVRKQVGDAKQKPQSKERQTWVIPQFLRVKGLLKQLAILVWDIFKRVSIKDMVKELEVNFRVGLGDPADTALIFGAIYPVTLLVDYYLPYPIRVQPSFDDDIVCEGYAYMVLRVRPVRLVVPIMRFAFSKPAIRALKTSIHNRWKRRN